MDKRCFYCNTEVPDSLLWWEVKGWVKKREQGGTNALVAEHRTGVKACVVCVTKLKDGVSPNQLTL